MPDVPPHHHEPGLVTELLRDVHDGSPGAVDRLMEIVLADLRLCANSRLANQPVRSDMRPTELINETYLRLFGKTETPSWNDRRHFFAVATIAMQQILVSRARRRRLRDTSNTQVPFDEQPLSIDAQKEPEYFIALSEALERLDRVHPRRCFVVRLKFFAGLTIDEIATLLDVSTPTVERDWAAASVWLRTALKR